MPAAAGHLCDAQNARRGNCGLALYSIRLDRQFDTTSRAREERPGKDSTLRRRKEWQLLEMEDKESKQFPSTLGSAGSEIVVVVYNERDGS
jgi:hypothetical protein